VTSSLAGRVVRPAELAGEVRIGGFGGPDGLARWLSEHRIDRVVDATHPFAARISASAVEACARAGVALERVGRDGFTPVVGDDWTWVDSLAEAAALITSDRRVLLTTGRLGLEAFAAVEAWTLIRCISEPDPPLPARHAVLLARGPFTLEGERALLDEHRIDLLVTKDSGGPAPKLDAARERGIPVIVVRRPSA